MVELEDHSRIVLDAQTRVRVRFSDHARLVELIDGQAQFVVAKDPSRPFKVQAGDHTIIAVGTMFTVEYIEERMDVAMLEGKVAVLSGAYPYINASSSTAPNQDEGGAVPAAASAGAAVPSASTIDAAMDPNAQPSAAENASTRAGDDGVIELIAGEGLRVRADGQATLIPQVDLEAAIAWRQGRVIFRSEPLGEAVRRLNRYSQLQLEVDEALAALRVSGVFETGDTAAFAEAVQSYLPVAADYSEQGVIRLRTK